MPRSPTADGLPMGPSSSHQSDSICQRLLLVALDGHDLLPALRQPAWRRQMCSKS